jgi:hypothetical protein
VSFSGSFEIRKFQGSFISKGAQLVNSSPWCFSSGTIRTVKRLWLRPLEVRMTAGTAREKGGPGHFLREGENRMKNPRTRRPISLGLLILGGVLLFLAPENAWLGLVFIGLGILLEVAGIMLAHRSGN